ncbi:MAG: flagellar protein FlaG [Pigmentiphaga sp.]|uniref:flagellar protein FlaG n=1 Tax=Pigmentiphaga sp. TaxID=1977564 RepID=UPI0029B0D32D|nr:flagellar protein FlaG [Pigmentiphaga sp.]MDX3904132.1 flagellar protein FlaG [Pigmentiphaga sp.]
MSIAPLGATADNRPGIATMTPAIAQVSPRGTANQLDPSLPITSQVPELEQLQAAVDNFNQFIPLAARNLTFSIDEDSGTVVVKVIDGDTQDVIRQIPSEEALALSRSLDQLKGLLLDGKA